MNGPVPIEWIDLHAYAQLSGAISEPWEAKALIAMSRHYLRGLTEGQDIMSIPPDERDDEDET